MSGKLGGLLRKFKRKKGKEPGAAAESIASAGIKATADQYEKTSKFRGPQGHGFAAEEANTWWDRLWGRKAKVVGGDNAKWGPDRVVDGRFIQTKTHATASRTIGACFDKDEYIYFDNGIPMGVEVPDDQYLSSVEFMRERIKAGQVPGITDPNKAEELVIRGPFTYDTIVNIAKFCTVESLAYDVATGVVRSSGIFSLAGTLGFAMAIWNGESYEEALKAGVKFGLRPAAVSMVCHVATQQFSRTEVSSVFGAAIRQIVSELPPSLVSDLANLGRTTPIYGAAATSHVSKLLSGSIVGIIASTVAIGVADTIELKRKKITTKRYFKNRITNLAGLITGTFAGRAGAAAGAPFGPGGAIFGGVVASIAVHYLSSKLTEAALNRAMHDSEEIFNKMLIEKISELVKRYLLSEYEVEMWTQDVMPWVDQIKMDRNFFEDESRKSSVLKLCETRAQVLLGSREAIPAIGGV